MEYAALLSISFGLQRVLPAKIISDNQHYGNAETDQALSLDVR